MTFASDDEIEYDDLWRKFHEANDRITELEAERATESEILQNQINQTDVAMEAVIRLQAENASLRKTISECVEHFEQNTHDEEACAMLDLCTATLNKETEGSA